MKLTVAALSQKSIDLCISNPSFPLKDELSGKNAWLKRPKKAHFLEVWNNCLLSFLGHGRTRDFAPTTTTNHYLTLGQSRLCSTSWSYRRRHSSHKEYSSSSSGFKLITKSNSVKPWLQVVLEFSPFRPLHPLPLDRHSTSRPVSTKIPRSLSALNGVNPQIMVTNRKWGSVVWKATSTDLKTGAICLSAARLKLNRSEMI